MLLRLYVARLFGKKLKETEDNLTMIIEAIVEQARQLRRRQGIDVAIAASGLVVAGAIEFAHNLFSVPRVESLDPAQVGSLAIASIAIFRALGCEFQGQHLDFRAITIVMEEAAKRPPSLR